MAAKPTAAKKTAAKPAAAKPSSAKAASAKPAAERSSKASMKPDVKASKPLIKSGQARDAKREMTRGNPKASKK